MDLNKALRELYEEKRRLDRAIARAEAKLAAMSQPLQRSRRGRKSMSPEERQQVSARMTAYWAARRAKKKQKNGDSDPVGNGITA
ncbi:MAG: hypothetical protein ABSH09_04820 [Bryobacteraceae bacterium]|jgi:chromosome segregation ATPase